MLKRCILSMFTLFQNKKFESLDSPLINTPAPQVSIQYQWPCDNSGKHKDQWCPPRYAPRRGDIPSREVGWRSSSTPKNDGIFLGMGGMSVLQEGKSFCFPVELHQSPTTGWFQPKNSFVCKARLASSLRERIFAEKKLIQKVPKIHPACRWSLDN